LEDYTFNVSVLTGLVCESVDLCGVQRSFGFASNNPLMKNITDYLVDEGSFEEDILLGKHLFVDRTLCVGFLKGLLVYMLEVILVFMQSACR